MSTLWSGTMRGPLVKIPVQLLLLMLCLSALASTVICQDSDYEVTDLENVIDKEEDAEETEADTTTTALDVSLATSPVPSEDPLSDSGEENGSQGSGDGLKRSRFDLYDDPSLQNATYLDLPESTFIPDEDESFSAISILIPVGLAVLLISALVCGIVLNRRWNQKARNQQSGKDDPHLDVDGTNTEKVPMPMFEEDVPSVLELEMDELDQWIKKDSGPDESLTQA